MNRRAWTTGVQLGVTALMVMAGAVFLAPTDLISVRGEMLAGLVGRYGSDQWVVTCNPSNQKSTSVTPGGLAFAHATSADTSLMLSSAVTGSSSTAVTAEAQGSYSGTWTFEWQPQGANDWPSDYTIASIHQQLHNVITSDGTGTAHVFDATETDLVNASLPNAGVDTADAPVIDVDVNTDDPDLTITTRTKTWRVTRGDTSTMSDLRGEVVTVERAYTTAWFQSHFMSPDDIVLTFTVDGVNLTAKADFATTSTDIKASASSLASDVYFGR